MTLDCYDWEGRPIDRETWVGLMEQERHVSSTHLFGGVPWHHYWVSTVWLGLDHSFGLGGPPLIFETMTFVVDGPRPWEDLDMRRYPTQRWAKLGHSRTVLQVQARMMGWAWDLTQMRPARI